MGPGLEKYYSGDRAWRAFVNTLPDYTHDANDHDWHALLKRVKDPDLARAIRFHIGTYAVAWLDENIDALNGTTPQACLKSHARTRRLREMLMRMP